MSFYDELLALAKARGWSIRYHNHPKTKANWLKPVQPHDKPNS